MSLPNSQLGAKELGVVIQVSNEEFLWKLDQSLTLARIIEQICSHKKLSYEEGQYALQLQDVNNTKRYKYVNESNRIDLKDVSVLKLVFSPNVMAKSIIDKVRPVVDSKIQGDNNITWSLNLLQDMSPDPSFTKEFIRQNGLPVIFNLIGNRRLPVQQQVQCLKTLDFMIDHISASLLTSNVIERIVEFVVGDKTPGLEIVAISLSILAQVIADNDNEYIATTVGLKELQPHLWNQDSLIQKNVMRLLNAMIRSKNNRKKHVAMVSRNMKETIASKILKSATPVDAEMAKELYNYQLMILQFKEKKFDTSIDPNDKDAQKVHELASLISTMNEDSTRSSIGSILDDPLPLLNLNENANLMQGILLPGKKGAGYIRSNSEKGSSSTNGINRSDCFERRPMTLNITPDNDVPINRLTLDCMLYFARNYTKQCSRLFQAEVAIWQPFPVTCQRLVRLVAEVLGIKKIKKFSIKKYQPLLFFEAAFIEELFCRMFLQLGRTRRDMKARTRSDQEKVMWVLQRQLLESLSTQPLSFKDHAMDLRVFNYAKVSELFQFERQAKEERKLNHSPPILELKASRRNEIIALIQQQRIKLVLAGTMFPKTGLRSQKLKKRSTFVNLTKNQKSLSYHDCDEDGRIIPDTSGKVNLSEVSNLVYQKKCPHISNEGKTNKADYEFAFSLILDQETSLDFIAPNQSTYDYWTDALNALLGKDMRSDSLDVELNQLLEMEVKLQLLDIQFDDIPNEPPPIPKEPPNYMFRVTD